MYVFYMRLLNFIDYKTPNVAEGNHFVMIVVTVLQSAVFFLFNDVFFRFTTGFDFRV